MKREYSRAVSALIAAMFSVFLFGVPAAAQNGELFILQGSADTISGPDWALDVTVSGNYAYVAQNASGFHVFDVSDVKNPVEVGAVTTEHAIRHVVVEGNYAYAVWWDNYSGGLYIYDVTNPASPAYLTTYSSEGECNGVAVEGAYAYLAETSGLRVLDISEPNSPELVGTYATPDDAWRIAVEGNLAYVVVHGYEAECGRQLEIISVTNPAEPALVGSCCLPDSYDEDYYDDYLYMYCYEIAVQDGFAFLGWGDGRTGGYFGGRLDTIDVSDPAHPERCSAYKTAPGIRGMAVDGDNLYLCLKQENLVGLGISDPCVPQFKGFAEAWGAMNAYARDGYVYLANGSFEDLMIFALDSDRDSLPDHDETLTDPYNWDSDGDLLSDGEEVLTYETDPLDRDSDGDGVDDGKEVAWGSDPLDPNDTVVLPLTVLTGLAGALGLAGLAILRRRGARI